MVTWLQTVYFSNPSCEAIGDLSSGWQNSCLGSLQFSPPWSTGRKGGRLFSQWQEFWYINLIVYFCPRGKIPTVMIHTNKSPRFDVDDRIKKLGKTRQKDWRRDGSGTHARTPLLLGKSTKGSRVFLGAMVVVTGFQLRTSCWLDRHFTTEWNSHFII